LKEKELVKLVIDSIEKKGNNWAYGYGREKLKKEAFIQKVRTDKKFRKFIARQVDALTVDIWTRQQHA